jgi:hypothetical protein
MKLISLCLQTIIAIAGISLISPSLNTSPAQAADLNRAISPTSLAQPLSQDNLVVDLFDVIRVVKDIDDIVDGDFGRVTPIKRVNRRIEQGLDDVNDTIEDTKRDLRRTRRRIDRKINRIADDVEDWFD